MNFVLTFDAVSKWYGDIIGLNDVSISIPSGITGLLGPNGAGKSTLINLITGRIKPSKGAVNLLGENPWNNYKITRFYGFVSEKDSYYERLTGLEFLIYMGRLHGYSKKIATQLAMEMLERHGLIHFQNKSVAAYSKGMRQRIKLAQSLLHDPEVLFLDEPLNGMDPIGRADTIELIKKLGAAGKTILVSSHILYEIEAMTENIILIHNGKVLAEGKVNEIRSLIDEFPHNVLIYSDRLRDMAKLMLDLQDVVNIRIEEKKGCLKIQSNQPDKFYHNLVDLIVEYKFNVTQIESPDDNLQSVFKYLVK